MRKQLIGFTSLIGIVVLAFLIALPPTQPTYADDVTPTATLTATATYTPTSTVTPTVTPTPCVVQPPIGWEQYTVQWGDTLYSLAVSRGTTVQEIRRVNCLTPGDVLRVGQVLWLPPAAAPTPTPTPTPGVSVTYTSLGHQQTESASGPRHLVIGPIVLEGERWTLRLIGAKNKMDHNTYPTDRETAEVVVCVFLLPRPSSHEPPPPGTWVELAGEASVPQFKLVKWEGALELPSGAQIGAWFRGAQEGDRLELNLIYDATVLATDEIQSNP